ncbi:MAG: branched-chain amino acid ABC transporter permease, partial [Paracoccaceae bacterium]
MDPRLKNTLLFVVVFGLILLTGVMQSWNAALLVLNMGMISAIMAIGVNMQWGFAGLFNVGVMGFVALGGLAAVLVAMPPVNDAWTAGGRDVVLALVLGAATITAAVQAATRLPKGLMRNLAVIVILVGGFF